MLLLVLRSFFFVAVIMGYSTGVWRLINDYFRQEFRTYLDEEVKKNKHLLEDPAGSQQAPVAVPSVQSESKQPMTTTTTWSVTSHRLLDELIISFGRLFTAGQAFQEPRRESAGIQSTSPSPPVHPAPKDPPRPLSETNRNNNNNIPDPGGGGSTGDGQRADDDDDTDSVDQTEKGSKGQQIEFASPSRTPPVKVDATAAAKTIIESDEFPRSSTMTTMETTSGNVQGDETGEPAEQVVLDEEEQWVQYWKKQRRWGGSEEEGDQCQQQGHPNNEPLSDGCELNLVPRG